MRRIRTPAHPTPLTPHLSLASANPGNEFAKSLIPLTPRNARCTPHLFAGAQSFNRKATLASSLPVPGFRRRSVLPRDVGGHLRASICRPRLD